MKKFNVKLIGAMALVIGPFGISHLSVAGETGGIAGSVDQTEVAFNAVMENRDSMISEIIEGLRIYAEDANYDASWEMEMTAALQNADNESLFAAYNARDYTSVVAAVSGKDFDKEMLLAAYEADGAPPAVNKESGRQAISAEVLGSTTHDFVYKPITPCRIVDTRVAGGIMGAGSTRSFNAHGNTATQGGTVCNDPPSDARAYMLNVTVTQPVAGGHVRIYPVGAALPNASIVNFSAGQTIANGIITKGGYIMGHDFVIYAGAATHVVVDLMGYFDPPERTLPDTYIVKSAAIPIAVNTYANVYSPNCPSGYRLMSGGAHNTSTYGRVVISMADTSSTGENINVRRWRCGYRSVGGASTATCFGYCVRIPGQ